MDIKQTIMDILNSDIYTTRFSIMMIEKLVLEILEDYVASQNKTFNRYYLHFNENALLPDFDIESDDVVFEFDGFAPEGFDNFIGKTAIEIKVYKSRRFSKNMFYDTVRKYSKLKNQIQNLLLIVIYNDGRITEQMVEEAKNKVGFNVCFWNINKLAKALHSEKRLFENTYSNLHSLYLKDTILNSIKSDEPTYLDKRKKYIDQLCGEYKKDNLVLFLGAGVSIDAKVPSWETLISELFVALINNTLEGKKFKINEAIKVKIAKELISQNGNSPLLQTRYLRNGLEDFQEEVRKILYKSTADISPLLTEIGQLCIPNRVNYGVKAIVTYNFDDLIEIALHELRIKYSSIYSEGVVPKNDELGIYHVHGFLPRDKSKYSNVEKSLLVFSEEGYHKLFLEPYHWSNITQLNFLTNNTCLFIGVSLTDPNLRRLLEVAAQKSPDGDSTCKHYAFMRRLHLKSVSSIPEIKNFEKANEALQESFYRELGINVLWVEEYSEIPKLLKEIKS